MATTRRYVVQGRMPLTRTPQSGLFTTRFKEDAFFVEFNDQALLFNDGARTEQSLQLPLYFIDHAYYQQKRQIETLGLEGSAGRVELYLQYAKLPLLDLRHLDKFRLNILERIQQARETFIQPHNPQAMLDMLLLQLCDEPIIFFEYDRTISSLRLKVRTPPLGPPPLTLQTKRGQINFFREYEDLLCSKTVAYALNAFEGLSSLQEVSISLARMEPEPVEGLQVIQEQERQKRVWRLRREVSAEESIETPKQRKNREAAAGKLLRDQEIEERAQKKERTKSKRQLEMTTRAPDGYDELFDGSLAHESILLAARIPRQAFLNLSRSKMSYSARQALEPFELRLNTDEEQTFFGPVESFFQVSPANSTLQISEPISEPKIG